MRLADDVRRCEPACKEMTASFVLPVEPLGVRSAQMLHSGGKIGVSGVNDEVKMRAHQAVGEAAPRVRVRDALELNEQAEAIVVFPKRPLLLDGQSRHVMNRIRKVDAFLARHPRESTGLPTTFQVSQARRHTDGAPGMARRARV